MPPTDRAAAIRSALLAPERIAIIGASDDPSKTSARPLQYLRRAGFAGRVYPVNPRSATVLGEPAWPSVEALPEVPDHAFILTTTEAACDAVEACSRLGVGAVTVLAGGFSEEGPEGAERQRRLQSIADAAGMLLLGPNSLGLVNPGRRLVLTANAAFAELDMPTGRTFVGSHSGSMLGALVSRGKARGIGFAGMVSVGSEAALSVGEICAATVGDPGIDSYLLFLESIRHGAWLRRFALEAARAGKPVVVYKLGRSEAGAALALSHTGAMAGEDAVADAFLRDCGFARVETFEAVFETPALLHRVPRPADLARRPRIGVVTTTGGGAAMVVDQLGVRGIDVAQPTDETFARLATRGVQVNPGLILDLTLAGTRYGVMRATIDTLLQAPEFDAVIAVAGSSARFQPQLAVKPIADADTDRGGNRKPLIAFLTPEAPEALRLLAEAGVPCFRTPEACADAIAAVASRRSCRPIDADEALTGRGTMQSAAGDRAHAGSRRMLDELAAYRLLSEFGLPSAPAVAVPIPSSEGGAQSLSAESLGPVKFPVAAKVLSPAIAHKTDVGGVVLGIADMQSLDEALHRIGREVRARSPGIPIESVLVQTMTRGVGEVLLGYRVDAEAGPIVMLAAGGIFAELYRDRSIRLAPVDLDTARAMIAEVRALVALAGFRGRPAGDLDALAGAIVALSRLAHRPAVVEAEINPLIVHEAGAGVTAVDAVAWVDGAASSTDRSTPARS